MFVLPRPLACRGLSLFAVSLLFTVSAIDAQTSLRSITGLVTDGTGAAVRGARVSVTNVAFSVRIQAASHAAGICDVMSRNPTILKTQGLDAVLALSRVGEVYYQTPIGAAGFPVGAKRSGACEVSGNIDHLRRYGR
jgi:hypothetical protein